MMSTKNSYPTEFKLSNFIHAAQHVYQPSRESRLQQDIRTSSQAESEISINLLLCWAD